MVGDGMIKLLESLPQQRIVELYKMVQKGYKRVSRKFGMLARLDRSDWKEECKRKGYPVNADWYRRCVSKDVITVSQKEALLFPPSCIDDTE